MLSEKLNMKFILSKRKEDIYTFVYSCNQSSHIHAPSSQMTFLLSPRKDHCSPRELLRDQYWVPLVAQSVKNLPAMLETRVQSLSWEDPLEKEMTTHSSILAWRIPWTEELGRLQSTGSRRVGHDWASNTFIFSTIIYIMEDGSLPIHLLMDT